MEAEFTKGPWVKDKRNENLVGSDGECVTIWGCGLTNAYKSETTTANAHLIAAAPDMYELLSKMHLESRFVYGEDYDEVEELLSKAHGE